MINYQTRLLNNDQLLNHPVLKHYIINGSQSLLKNCDCKMTALETHGVVLPVIFNNPHNNQCYLVSLHQYLTYAAEHLEDVRPKFLRSIYKLAFKFLLKVLKICHVDQTLQINNWLVPTSLYPKLNEKQVAESHRLLLKTHKNYAYWWRSVSPHLDSALFQTLTNMGAAPLFARPAYYIDGTSSDHEKKRHYKQDVELLKNFSGDVLKNKDLKKTDYEIIAKLNNQLQCEKYSQLNPILSEKFIAVAIENNIIEFTALKIENQIVAVYGSYVLDGVMTAPVWGYDTNLPQDLGLYRMLTVLSIQEAAQKKVVYHMNGGAGDFKQKRGAQSYDEYHFIFIEHLPKMQKIGWKIVTSIVNLFAHSALNHRSKV